MPRPGTGHSALGTSQEIARRTKPLFLVPRARGLVPDTFAEGFPRA